MPVVAALCHSIFKSGVHRLQRTWFLEIDLVHEVCMCIRMSVGSLEAVITSGIMWCDMDLI